MVMRANIGCGSIRPLDWLNFDLEASDSVPIVNAWDVREPLGDPPVYDYAVCSFMLQELNHHEIPGALENIKAILKPGGVLRVLVPEIHRAFTHYAAGDEAWFPQDERTGDLDAKFCTYVTWYGTSRSVFTPKYLMALMQSVFGRTERCRFKQTYWGADDGITELDSRRPEALIVEAAKW